MGTRGFEHAATVDYRPGEIILEVGSGESTRWLAGIGPVVHTIDVDELVFARARTIPNVYAHLGRAEDVLPYMVYEIGFAWLDGWDYPYAGNPPGYYAGQRARYTALGLELSREASIRSHLQIVKVISHASRYVAFDDTWATHAFAGRLNVCCVAVPPATPPAPALAMDRPLGGTICGLPPDHPHHERTGKGWSGKGGDAIPYLLSRGFEVVTHGLGLAVLAGE